jgi:Flp pilus assembly protein TadG
MRKSWLGRLRDETAGIAATEFAFVAPLLLGGLLAMVDAGSATAIRMEMDRNVRAGAQAAMSLNNDADAIETIVLSSADNPEDMDVDVQLVCACSDIANACTAPCATGAAPDVFFDITAERAYDGILLGDRLLRAHTRVQIR